MYFYCGNYCCRAYKALHYDFGDAYVQGEQLIPSAVALYPGRHWHWVVVLPRQEANTTHYYLVFKHFICLLNKVARNYNKINEEIIYCIIHHLTAASLCGYCASTAQSNAGANGVATRGRTVTVARAYTCDACGSGVYTVWVLRARSLQQHRRCKTSTYADKQSSKHMVHQ